MAERIIQSSFNTGELAPTCFARTDLAKYHSAAALLRNFFVDYRGGASTRSGTRYINRTYKSASASRLIPFQASFAVSYMLEFGDHYIRFINNGAPVLEGAIPLGAANPYVNGDWVYLTGSGTVYDGNYFIVTNPAPLKLTDLFSNAIATPAAGSTARIYTIASPYAAADVFQLKFAQDVSSMILCHPNYTPYALVLTTATNWSMAPIQFGTAAATPQNVVLTTRGINAGNVSYSYVVTSVDSKGEESAASAPGTLNQKQDLRNTNGTIRVAWSQAAGAKSYNVYKSDITYFGAVPPGVAYGYIGSTSGTEFDDSNIAPDFTQTPPILQIPFLGGQISGVTVTSPGVYTSVPNVTAGAPGVINSYPAQLAAILVAQDPISPPSSDASRGFAVGDVVYFANGLILNVTAVLTGGQIGSYGSVNDPGASPGQVINGNTPANPMQMLSTSGAGTNATARVNWGVGSVVVLSPGSGYMSNPAITFDAGAPTATATATVSGTVTNNYPTVPAFCQQRLFLGGGIGSPNTFYMSRPGNHYNFNISNPIQPDDAIQASLTADQLNTIKAATATSAGLIIFTDRTTWLVTGGGAGTAITPAAIVANPQSNNGASDVQPILSNFDLLFVQAKGSIVRDSSYNIYANIYTGQDITTLSSHLFYGYQLIQWAYAEEPYKLVWAVRNDGVLLSLTFLKEQEFVGWAHSDTVNGKFESVATVVENVNGSNVDAVYVVVNRTINNQTVRYIERLQERQFTTKNSVWCVDAGIAYSGAPKKQFSGAQHLAGQTVTGVADGVVLPPFVMPATGQFVLGTAASVVTIGLGFTAQLQTLAIDTGEPTVQGKQKRIVNAIARLNQTLSLKAGRTFTSLVSMKDTVLGNVGKMSNTIVTDLVSADAEVLLDPKYDTAGQFCFQQDQPYPATILGVIPTFEIGDSK